MFEMLGTQNILREEMKEKELYKQAAAEHLQNLCDTQQLLDEKVKEHERITSELRHEITLQEDKNLKLLASVEGLKAEIAKHVKDKESVRSEMREQTKDME
jgi:hypothetical protein